MTTIVHTNVDCDRREKVLSLAAQLLSLLLNIILKITALAAEVVDTESML